MKYEDLATDFLNKALKVNGWRKDNTKCENIYSETELDEDGIFPVLLEKNYITYFSCATWISCKQRLFLISLAQQDDKDSKSYSIPSINGINVKIDYIDQKTGATTIKFSKNEREQAKRKMSV